MCTLLNVIQGTTIILFCVTCETHYGMLNICSGERHEKLAKYSEESYVIIVIMYKQNFDSFEIFSTGIKNKKILLIYSI